MKTSSLRRFGFAALLFICLGGPTPGAVGSCNDDVPLADPVDFCIAKKRWICVRDTARGDLQISGEDRAMCEAMANVDDRNACLNAKLQETRDECIINAPSNCAGFAWANCDPPNQIQADACLQALRSQSRLGEKSDDIIECKAEVLCPALEATGALTAEEVTP